MDGEKVDKLSLLVCEYEELYDMSNKNYSNQNRQENIWSEIGKKINESGETCKKKWKSLRDAFQKAAKSRVTKSGDAAKNSKKWKYWDVMSFLLPHIKGRETQTNVCDQETDENLEGEVQAEEINIPTHLEEAEEKTVEDESDKIPTSPSLPLPNTPQSRSSSGVNISRSVSRATRTKSDMPKNTKTVAKKTEALPDILKEYVQDKKRSRIEKQALTAATQSTDGQNSAHLQFFTTMAKTTATFPPVWQAKVRSRLFEIVNSCELALLETTSTLPTPPLLTDSQSHIQQQSHRQHMQNVPMYSQSPSQYQSPIQIQQSMQMQPSVHNQPSSSSFFHNGPIYSSQNPSADFYSTFATRVSATERSDEQNNVGATTSDLDTPATYSSNQQQGNFSYKGV